MQAPRLTDGVVVLRALEVGDLDDVVARCQDDEIQRWTSVPVPYARADAEAFLERCRRGWDDGTVCELAVEVDGRNAGHVTLRLDGAHGGDIGYALAPWARGRGVMARSVRLLLAWAYTELDLAVAHWRAHVGNWPSRRVAWSCGFAVEGKVRGLCVHRGERRDAWVGSLRRHDPMRSVTRWLDLPELHAGSVVLRANRPDDVQRIVEACNDPVTQLFLPELPSPYALTDAVAYLESRAEAMAAGEGLYWAVADADDRLLAQIALMGVGRGGRSAEIGYWTHPDARGTGVMPTAVGLVARHAMLSTEDGGLGLARVFLRVAARNTASVRVAQKAGFTECGVDRKAEQLRDGSVQDFRRFDLLVDEMEQAWAHPSALR